MPVPSCLIDSKGRLTDLARGSLHALTGVGMHLLSEVRIRRASENWLHAPWYVYERGGAITIGRTIWFTRKWFEAEGFGDGSRTATWNWLRHLAHEVGHLPQAERFGYGPLGKARYVFAFAWQYGTRAITFKKDAHDGAPLEIEADRGRWVLDDLVGDQALSHPLVLGLHTGNAGTAQAAITASAGRVADLSRAYALGKRR